MERLITKMLGPLRRQISNMITRARITSVNSNSKTQLVQVGLRDEDGKTDVEEFEPYGFTSHPHVGAEGLHLAFGGDTSHSVVICIGDKRFRLTSAKPGEVAMYDDLGQVVHLTREGIKIATDLDVELRGKHVRIHGDESLIIECNGHGQKWLPDRLDTYRIGAEPGVEYPINSPEIP